MVKQKNLEKSRLTVIRGIQSGHGHTFHFSFNVTDSKSTIYVRKYPKKLERDIFAKENSNSTTFAWTATIIPSLVAAVHLS